MRTPRAAPRPRAASPIIAPMAETANAPLATPEQQHRRPQRPDRRRRGRPRASADDARRRGEAAADRPGAHRAAAAAADQAAADRDQHHAGEHAAMLQPGQPGDCARREAEHGAGERLEDQFLRAVGQHRDEHEDREAARLRLRPDLAQRRQERLPGGAGCARRRRGVAFDAATSRAASAASRCRGHAGGDRQQPRAARTGRAAGRRRRR